MALQTLVVGFGYAATTFHLPFLQALEAFDVRAVVSSSADKVHASLADCQVYSSMDEALNNQQFDLVIITTPNHLHGLQARKALLANCHVLVEKPFTLSAKEARELMALATARQLTLCVFQNRRFDGDFTTVGRLLKEKKLGDIKRIVSRFDRFRPHPKDRWRENAGPGSGIFWDLGPHLIDQAITLFGKPEKVSGYLHISRSQGQSVDTFELTLHYADLTYHIGSSPFQANETLRFELQGTKGSYRHFGLDPQELQLKNGDSPLGEDFGRGANDGQLCNAERCVPIKIEKGQYINFYKQLAACIVDKLPPPVDADDVIATIDILERVTHAAEVNTANSVVEI